MLGASMSHSRSQGQQTLPLLHRRNALLLLYALLYALDGVGGLDVYLNLLARQCLDLDHHPSPGAKHHVLQFCHTHLCTTLASKDPAHLRRSTRCSVLSFWIL